MHGPRFLLLTLVSAFSCCCPGTWAQSPTQQTPPVPNPEIPPAIQDALPWLPGGNPPAAVSSPGMPQIVPAGQPPLGQPIPGAQPIQTSPPSTAFPGSSPYPRAPNGPSDTELNAGWSQPSSLNPPMDGGPVIPAAYTNAQGVMAPAPAAQQTPPQGFPATPPQGFPTTPPQGAAATPTQGVPGTAAGNPNIAPPTTTGDANLLDSQITKVTKGLDQLPNESGQVWRTYDISPYTHSVQTNTRPEQALIDWILKETGTDFWFVQPMGILSASRDKLHIYHTPAIHERLRPIIDRFVQSRGQPLVIGLRLLTIGSPNWRTTALPLMQPMEVNSPGVEAWLVTKENAAILGGIVRKRGDFMEHNSNDMAVASGQKYTLARKQPLTFTRSIGIVNDGVPRYQPLIDRIDQGYQLDFSTMASLDGQSIETIVKFEINQVEGVQPVNLNLPTAGGQTQPFQLQIPQLVSRKIEERFRWPSNMVLVLSCGVVATPGPQKEAFFGIPNLVNGTKGRADALMVIEYKGPAQGMPGVNPGAPQTQVPNVASPGVMQPVPRR